MIRILVEADLSGPLHPRHEKYARADIQVKEDVRPAVSRLAQDQDVSRAAVRVVGEESNNREVVLGILAAPDNRGRTKRAPGSFATFKTDLSEVL